MKKVYDNLDTSQNNKNDFNQIRDELNSYLDSGSHFEMSDEGFALHASPPYENTLTHREILELFVYGEFSHTNQIKREKLKQLLSNPVFAAFAWLIFTNILIQIIKCSFAVAVINQRVISEIEV